MATAMEMAAVPPSPTPANGEKAADASMGSPSSEVVNERAATPDMPKDPMRPREGSTKIGHRKVVDGKVMYKKTASEDLMMAIQLGLRQSVGSITPKERRDLLMQDFAEIEIVDFPSAGSSFTPVHRLNDFSFKSYAPRAFRHFREAYDIKAEDFLLSLCNDPLRELSNPGASGSLFYISYDDAFIIKTVQKKEAEFLRKLLPQYYMNMMQNKNTLLPKFFGLYTYQSNIGRNIRFVVMNNLLPSRLKYHERYDLKGSTHNRKASEAENRKKDPTFKDLDLKEKHPKGLRVAASVYEGLCNLILRDCRVLSSLKIMDYSMLVGIHKIDPTVHEAEIRSRLSKLSDPNATTDFKNGLLAVTENNEWCLVFIGIIDILQQYKLRKKLEHTWKAFWYDGDTVSVVRPEFYSERFQDFMRNNVFQSVKSLDSIPIVPLPPSVAAAGVAPVSSVTEEHILATIAGLDPGQASGLVSASHNAVAPTAFITSASPAVPPKSPLRTGSVSQDTAGASHAASGSNGPSGASASGVINATTSVTSVNSVASSATATATTITPTVSVGATASARVESATSAAMEKRTASVSGEPKRTSVVFADEAAKSPAAVIVEEKTSALKQLQPEIRIETSDGLLSEVLTGLDAKTTTVLLSADGEKDAVLHSSSVENLTSADMEESAL